MPFRPIYWPGFAVRKKERKRRDLGRNAIDRTFGIQLFAEETTTINWLIIGDHWPNLASVDVIMHLTNTIFLDSDYFRVRLTRNMMDRAPIERFINVFAFVFPAENQKIRKSRLVLLKKSWEINVENIEYWLQLLIAFFFFFFFLYSIENSISLFKLLKLMKIIIINLSK